MSLHTTERTTALSQRRRWCRKECANLLIVASDRVTLCGTKTVRGVAASWFIRLRFQCITVVYAIRSWLQRYWHCIP